MRAADVFPGKRLAAAFAVALAMLTLAAVAAAATPGAAPGSKLSKAVDRFVGVKGEPTEKRMASFSKFLSSLPKAESACASHPLARQGVADTLREVASGQVSDVLFVEHGELHLYKLAPELPEPSRGRFVNHLELVSNRLDQQLREAKADRDRAGKVASDCGALASGSTWARTWTRLTKSATSALAGLKLAWGS